MFSDEPSHPFVQKVRDYIDAQDGCVLNVIRVNGKESVSLCWNPPVVEGMLCFDAATARWAQYEIPREYADLRLDVSCDQRFAIVDNDGGWKPVLQVVLRGAAELPELAEFFTTARASAIGSSALTTRPISSLVEGCFLVVPTNDGTEHELLPFNGPSLASKFPEMMEWVDKTFRDAWWITSESGFDHLGEFLEKKGLRDQLPPLVPLQPEDILVDSRGRLRLPETISDDAAGEYGVAPCFALRLRRDVSAMWFSDYLEYASEADGLLIGILHDWKRLPSLLKELTVELPSTKRDQVAHAVELRQARLAYQEGIERLSSTREPFKEISRLYRKRAHAVEAVHGESLDDIQSIQRPLPFFLEYPYRAFRREDDHLRKVRAGQRLLGLLIKVPTYLVIEELLVADDALGQEALARIEERPLSEGGMLELRRFLLKRLGPDPASRLRVFGDLVGIMADVTDFDKMVEARNRMHHEPYDERAFLAAVDAGAPRQIDALREALHGIKFLVPQHGRKIDGERRITAEDVCAAEANFRRVEFATSLSLESFPAETLVAWQKSPEVALELGRLVTSKVVTHQSRDFGVFDRVQKNERHFTFLRSE
jgi:hypothetical protein